MNHTLPQVFSFPATDTVFKMTAETSLAVAGRGRIDDPGVLAAAEALLRPTYPLAIVQLRNAGPGRGGVRSVWDAFRDDAALDDELVHRARTGDDLASDQLYERHHRLAYAVAVQIAGRSEAALDAVVAAFREIVLDDTDEPAVRTRLALAARRGAVIAVGRETIARDSLQRAVLELAYSHRLSAPQIAVVLGLHRREVAALAREGLTALAARRAT